MIRAAGRINVLGTHIDHRGGSVNPVAVNHMWLVVAPRDDDLVTARERRVRASFPERFRIRRVPARGDEDRRLGLLVSGGIREAQGRCLHHLVELHPCGGLCTCRTSIRRRDGTVAPPVRGMDMVFYGNIPRAVGLSSSSAVVVATAEAVVRLNALEIDRSDLVTHCGYAEWYVGTRGGSSDHAAIIFAEPNAILHIAAFALSVESVPVPDGYSLVLANSLIEAKKQAGGPQRLQQPHRGVHLRLDADPEADSRSMPRGSNTCGMSIPTRSA